VVGAKGFEPSTSWSRTSGQNHISRCPGVTYWLSGRSLMDKSGQATNECWREPWGIDSKTAATTQKNNAREKTPPGEQALPGAATNQTSCVSRCHWPTHSVISRMTVAQTLRSSTLPVLCEQIERPWSLRPRLRQRASRFQPGCLQPQKLPEGWFREGEEPFSEANLLVRRCQF
jgi:hypothetical protein